MTSAYESLKPLFDPRSIAIIGASNDVQKFGGRPIRYSVEGGYKGTILPINPKGGEIQGFKAYRDIREAPGPVDLVIISVPAPGVVEAIEQCAEAKARSAVIFSSGFAELGGEGEAWQARLSEIAQRSGIRLVGPNCMGMLNVKAAAVGTFSSAFEHGWPRAGAVAVMSQSGAVGSHCLVLARQRGLGLRGWVTTGNECDVDVAELIAFCAEDPETKVIVAYMEGCKRPDAFCAALEQARRAGKPVIVMKVGASDVGRIAASSHTASLAGADEVFDAVFRQYGVHRARTLDELIDVAAACSAGHFPRGRRLGVVTISGGVGVLASDAAAQYGLEVPELPKPTQERLKALMPFATPRNPVDTTATVLNDMRLLRESLDAVLSDGDVDAVLCFLTSLGYSKRMMPQLHGVLGEIRARHPGRLVMLSMMCHAEDRIRLEEGLGFVVFEDPSRAIAAIAALARFGESFARPAREAPPSLPELSPPRARRLSELEAAEHLRAAGLPVIESRLARSADEAAAAARALGFPVALKVVSAEIAHKSDVGGVRLKLGDEAAVREAFDAVMAAVKAKAPKARVDGVLVAPMVEGGVECILGASRDPVFGPMVLFGLGGVFVEVLKDASLRRAPFGRDEARRMIGEIKGLALLQGARGRAPADLDALADALARLSAYAYAMRDSVESVDLNPVLALPDRCVAVDALIAPRL